MSGGFRWPWGRRGAVLSLFGVTWVLLGWAILTAPSIAAPPGAIVAAVPADIRGAGWLVTGFVAAVTSAWPPGRDRWGFTAAVLMPLLHVAGHSLGWVLSLVTKGGEPRGWTAAAVYGALAAVLMIVAGWPEDRRHVLPFPPRPEDVEQ